MVRQLLMGLVCVLCAGQMAPAGDREKILAGAKTCLILKFSSLFSVYGEDAFVVVSESPGEEALPIIAAGKIGRGRLAVLGHDTYLDPKHLAHEDTGRIVKQLFVWASGVPADRASSMKIGTWGRKDLAELLTAKGFAVRDLTRKIPSGLDGMDLVVGTPYNLTDADVSALLSYARGGGGIVLAGQSWSWAQKKTNVEQIIGTEFPGNKIASKAGILWNNEMVWSEHDAPPLAPDSPAQHGLATLRLLQSVPAEQIPAETLDNAVYNLLKTVSVLPQDDSTFLPEVKQAIARSSGGQDIIPSKQNKITNKQPLARIAVTIETKRLQSLPPEEIRASPMASTFPGVPPKSAPRITKQIPIDPQTIRWHSTGLYAAAGDVITARFPASATTGNLKLRIGTHKDKLWHLEKWERSPDITREFEVSASTVKIASAFGGLIYLDVPEGCALEPFDLEVEGAVAAPRYVFGQTSLEQWKIERTHPAPWAEVGSDKLIFTVPTADIVGLENPEQLMVYWNRVMDADAELAAISYDRTSPERFTFDQQISAGYMHAGYPIMAFLPQAKEMMNLEELRQKGNWGAFHELGHNHQKPEWTWEGLGEVTVNLFSVYNFDTLLPQCRMENAISAENRLKRTKEFIAKGDINDPFTRLIPYLELKEQFGWQPFKNVFAKYQEIPKDLKPKSTQDRKDLWLVMFSEEVGHNLAPFYEFWKFEPSPSAVEKVVHLPVWNGPRREGLE